jgi:hypothetical protein
MNFNNYLLAGFDILFNTTITISGYQPIDAIFDSMGQSHEKQYSFIEDFESPVIVRSNDLPDLKKTLIGKHVLLALDNQTYRIDRIKVGGATTFLYFSSKEKS